MKWATATFNAAQALINQLDVNPNLLIITHDSFEGPTNFVLATQLLQSLHPAGASLPAGQTTTFAVDVHNYQLYSKSDNALDQPSHIREACTWAKPLASTRAAGLPVYVGEWSALTNICVRADGSTFAGIHCDASRDGKGCQCTTAPALEWNKNVVAAVRQYIETQMDIWMQNTDGDFFWSFGAPGGWGVENLIKVGAFPSPFPERRFPPQC